MICVNTGSRNRENRKITHYGLEWQWLLWWRQQEWEQETDGRPGSRWVPGKGHLGEGCVWAGIWMCGGSKTYKHLRGAFPAEEPWNKASDKEHRPGHVLQEPPEGQHDGWSRWQQQWYETESEAQAHKPMWGLASSSKEFRTFSKCDGKPLEASEQGNKTQHTFETDQSLQHVCALIFPSYNTTNYTGLEPTLMTSFTLITLLKAFSSNTITFWASGG